MVRKIQTSDKTKALFQPFYELKTAIEDKSRYLNDEEYKKMVDDCLSSFYGVDKLSPNRKMFNYHSIIFYIYHDIDSNMFFEKFINTFGNKISSCNKDHFLLEYLRKLRAPFDDEVMSEVDRVFSLVSSNSDTREKLLDSYTKIQHRLTYPNELLAAIEKLNLNKAVSYSDIDNEQPSKKRRL